MQQMHVTKRTAFVLQEQIFTAGACNKPNVAGPGVVTISWEWRRRCGWQCPTLLYWSNSVVRDTAVSWPDAFGGQ